MNVKYLSLFFSYSLPKSFVVDNKEPASSDILSEQNNNSILQFSFARELEKLENKVKQMIEESKENPKKLRKVNSKGAWELRKHLRSFEQ